MGKIRLPLFHAGIEALGDWNPQFVREIQGRLRLQNILMTVLGSLIGQACFLFWRYRTLEQQLGRCEKVEFVKTGKECIQVNDTHYFLVNWQAWWLEVFVWGCVLMVFGLVVGGSFLLISNLSKEERRGTLTFISLSPQSAQIILIGKLMGVPILIFLAALLALPLHYFSGLSAGIPSLKLLSFDGVVLASCLFFYSLSLFLGLVGHWLNGFQTWLGSAGIFMLLLLLKNNSLSKSAADWLYAFSPTVLLPYVIGIFNPNFYALNLPFNHQDILNWHWFKLPLGESGLLVVLFVLVNYGLWTGWLWQPLQRRFRNPQVSLLSKKQSYGATLCLMACLLGFALPRYPDNINFETVFLVLLAAHFLWFLLLIVLLMPQYQALQDWARFRGHYSSAKGRRQRLQDLVWADDSPTWLAIALNLSLANLPIIFCIFTQTGEKGSVGLVALLFNSTLILILTLFTQVVLLRSLVHRNLWAIAALLGPVILPSALLILIGVQPSQTGGSLLLLTPFALAAIPHISVTKTMLMLALHGGAIASLLWWCDRQLQSSAKSTTQRLFRGETRVEQG